jgi:tellurite resistance protein
MENEVRINLLARIARSAAAPGVPVDPAKPVSILSLAAASYGSRPSEDATVPTGFDPVAVALFEAIVEGAFLTANADGVFDDDEQHAFEQVVVAACGGSVPAQQVAALVSDLRDQLEEDGMDQRVAMLARGVTKQEHAQEVLRISALLAQSNGEISHVEREVLGKIAGKCGLDKGAVDVAVGDVRAALAAAGSR